MNDSIFRQEILEGIPAHLPPYNPIDTGVNHAPARKCILNTSEKMLALKNALRYFPVDLHKTLAPEFLDELNNSGRIYMYRYRPQSPMFARPAGMYPARSKQAASIMMMIQNNLDPEVAQHPHELITYGGNGAVFQNWAQYRLTMKYLAEMTDEQTLVMYSGHPLGLFPSHRDAPRVVVTNGMMVPNYSGREHYEKFNAMGVTQYGQMTAGSYMYIGPQGIVHGTTITMMNAARLHRQNQNRRMILVSSGLGGMSGAQPKAARIAGIISVVAEMNPKAIEIRKRQGWVDEVFIDLDKLINRIKDIREKNQVISLAYSGNVVDLWEALAERQFVVDLGSDQTSLHNPFNGGYYPAGFTFEESNRLMVTDPDVFREKVQESIRRQVAAIKKHTQKGMYFWDYGNAFLLEASRAGAPVTGSDGRFCYPSYVQDIMGPLYFDYGFGPFRWICTSGKTEDLEITDRIAFETLLEIRKSAPDETRAQWDDNIHWIQEAGKNNLVVGTKARILYADHEGRSRIAHAFNKAIRKGEISAPLVLGRDHHDVSGTDSPWRETSNICDGSAFTADMAVQNFAGNSFRGATWVSLHNGGGTGWGEAINGGFGLTIDGTSDAERRIEMIMQWDVLHGIARRSWAQNQAAKFTIKRALKQNPELKVTIPHQADNNLIKSLFEK